MSIVAVTWPCQITAIGQGSKREMEAHKTGFDSHLQKQTQLTKFILIITHHTHNLSKFREVPDIMEAGSNNSIETTKLFRVRAIGKIRCFELHSRLICYIAIHYDVLSVNVFLSIAVVSDTVKRSPAP